MVSEISGEVKFLTLDDVLHIHRDQIDQMGGDPSLRSKGLLRACISVPSNKIGGHYAHQDIFEMAAAYIFHIIDQRPFTQANQRVAAMSCLYFLYLHQIDLTCSPEDFTQLVRKTSEGKNAKMQIADFLRRNSSIAA